VGEGAIWDAEEQVLYWVDILNHQLYIYDPKTRRNRTIETCQAVGTVVPRASGGLMVALHNGFASVDLETEKITPFGDPERDIPANRFNDGKCDPAGRFWAGTMEFGGEPERGVLYCLDVDHTIAKKVSPVTISNGIVWSADQKTMYYIDTELNNVRAYDYEVESGDIRNERVVVENQGGGHFDGMSIDEEGMLWIALFGGWGVSRYNPNNGELLQEVSLPAERVTSCAFGGENLDELYITSATFQMSQQELEEQPLAGSLLRVHPGARGVPAHAYAG
jgi:sugar lactone lactonase YvrE